MNETNPLRYLRALKGAPLSILVALKLIGKPVSQAWLESATGYTDKTLSRALLYLQEIGLVNGSPGFGWIVSEAEIVVTAIQPLLETESRNFSDSDEEEDEEENLDLNHKQDSRSSSPPRASDGLARNYSDSKSEIVAEMPITADLQLPVARLLRAAGVMPGEITAILADASVGLEDALAEIAYCYKPGNGIRLPDRIIGRNLLEGHRPSAEYYEHPEGMIPKPLPPEAEEGEEPATGLLPPVPDDSVHLPLEGCPLTPLQAWERAREQLRPEMPRGSWTTYLEPAWLREYREGVFVVEAQGEYAREWLESRLTSTLERVLSGICNQSMRVRFERCR